MSPSNHCLWNLQEVVRRWLGVWTWSGAWGRGSCACSRLRCLTELGVSGPRPRGVRRVPGQPPARPPRAAPLVVPGPGAAPRAERRCQPQLEEGPGLQRWCRGSAPGRALLPCAEGPGSRGLSTGAGSEGGGPLTHARWGSCSSSTRVHHPCEGCSPLAVGSAC